MPGRLSGAGLKSMPLDSTPVTDTSDDCSFAFFGQVRQKLEDGAQNWPIRGRPTLLIFPAGIRYIEKRYTHEPDSQSRALTVLGLSV